MDKSMEELEATRAEAIERINAFQKVASGNEFRMKLKPKITKCHFKSDIGWLAN